MTAAVDGGDPSGRQPRSALDIRQFDSIMRVTVLGFIVSHIVAVKGGKMSVVGNGTGKVGAALVEARIERIR